MPTVSVIIPAYNRVSLLREAIQSVLDQTYDDYEIIIVDDGSTEPISSVIGIDDKRIRHVRQENRGPASARNHGIDLARGRYIAFLDSDDIFLPNKLERQVGFMERNQNALLSHTSYQRITIEGKFIEDVQSGTFSGNVYPVILRNCPIATPTVMVSREVFDNNLRFNEAIHVGEDVVLWAQIAKKHVILGIDEPLTKVRIHKNTAAFDPQAKIIGLMNLAEYAVKKDTDLSRMTRRKLLSNLYISIAFYSLKTSKKWLFLEFFLKSIFTYPFNTRHLNILLLPFFRLSTLLHFNPTPFRTYC